MVNFCCVYKCSKRSDRDKDVSYYRIPKIISHQGEQTRELSEERVRAWLSAIHRKDRTAGFKDWEKICSRHFVSGKLIQLNEILHSNPS